LRGSDFSGSDLRGSDLSDCDLIGSDLSDSDLSGCNLRYSDLSGCNLRYSNLSGSSLRGSDLRGSDLSGSDLSGASLNWQSHHLIGEILWRAADTEQRKMVAAYVGRRPDWCWDHPKCEWAVVEMAGWVKDGDGAPDWIRDRAGKEDSDG